ncbi:thaumatin-like protein [Triticum dicoccoides]|uniref:Uncharacterized protein n=1 Tax=Triticum turgidum subsp. durum TaxID=4567 RepID=A0A9R1S2W9_TRITD|nr:thaumatin-like protein [Triticum dicoccoides]VAH77784.1 unnamed protein product [Triticum turgidum subsp. durum]
MATPAATSLALAVILLLVAFTAGAGAATFSITNRCPFPVCAAAMPVSGGGGTQLAPGETWTLTFAAGGTSGRIWPRTGCAFHPATGRGGYQTGDCGGALRCVLSGKPPATLAEFNLANGGAPGRYGISVVDGFTLPMDFSCSGAGDGGVIRCRDPGCPDGNHRPGDGKYRACPAYSDYKVVFCP